MGRSTKSLVTCREHKRVPGYLTLPLVMGAVLLVCGAWIPSPVYADSLSFEQLKSTERTVRRLAKRRISRNFDCLPYQTSTRTFTRCTWRVVTEGTALIPTDTDIGWELSVVDGAGGAYYHSPTLVQNRRQHGGGEELLIFRPATNRSAWIKVIRRNTDINSQEQFGTKFTDTSNRQPHKMVWETVQWTPHRPEITDSSLVQRFTETVTINRIDRIQKNYRR